MLWRPSSSSYLYRGRTELHGLRGQRIYIAVARASDIPLLGQLLYERLWALGYGYVVVSASGQLLDRTLLDASVWQPERLDFAAGPTCVPPLVRRVPRHTLWHADVGDLGWHACLKDRRLRREAAEPLASMAKVPSA